MTFDNTIIYLFGFPGTGKYTIAKEITQQAGFVLIDNHLINNPVFSVVQPDGKSKIPEAVWGNCAKIWHIVWDTILHIAPQDHSYVLTNALFESNQGDKDWFFEVADYAAQKKAMFLPVRLLCSEEQLRKRILSPDRKARHKMTDPDAISEYVQNDDVLMPDHQNLMTLDVTELSPEKAAALILKEVSRLVEERAA